jgi:hypothetical protein
MFAVVFVLTALFPPLAKEGAEKRSKSGLAVPAGREISPPTWATGGKVRIERTWEKGKLLIVEISLNTEARGIQMDAVVHCWAFDKAGRFDMEGIARFHGPIPEFQRRTARAVILRYGRSADRIECKWVK